MSTKTYVVIFLLLLGVSLVNAVYTSPGWSYGYELGLARGDNAGSRENLAPFLRGNLDLRIYKFLYMRLGMGYTQLHASKTYSTRTLMGDSRLVVRPYRNDLISPFFYAGQGFNIDLRDDMLGFVPLYPIGVGIQTKYKTGVMLEVTAGYNISNSDKLDGRKRSNDDKNWLTGRKQDGFYTLSVGLSYFDPGPEPHPITPVPQVDLKPVQPTPPPPPPPTPTPTPPPPPPVKELPIQLPDPKLTDSDKDGLSDYDELNVYKTDPFNPDTDGDGLKDGEEVLQYKTDPLNPDTDGDGLNDGDEVLLHRTDPLKVDTDGDGLNDYAEVMLHKTNPLVKDTDGDGLIDGEEVMQYKTDPLKKDTDGDGLTDGDEVLTHKTNPLNKDTDGDGLTDGEEVLTYLTNPLDKDTDKGSVDDGVEVKAGTNPLDSKDDVIDLREGAKMSLEGILFETGKAVILPASIPILEKAYGALAANPEVRVRIIGHTDSVGSASSNLTLSQRRADSVRTWLINRGIAADRMESLGKGLTDPRATNSTPEGRQLNRRIEFEVIQ